MKIKYLITGIGALVVITGLSVALSLQLSGGPSTDSVSTVSATESMSSETAKFVPSGNPSDGISIHGDWTIDVYNANGTLANHRTFKNGLTSTAPLYIGQLFGHSVTPGTWRINLSNSAVLGTGPCGAFIGTPRSCTITEPTDASAGQVNVFDNLTVVVPGDGLPISPLRLTGSATVSATASINEVGTFIRFCNSSISTDQCAGEGNGILRSFASTEIDRIAVTPGQIIQVKVEYSFATGQ